MTHAARGTRASMRRMTARIHMLLEPRLPRRNRSVVRCEWCGKPLARDLPLTARTCSEICARRV